MQQSSQHELTAVVSKWHSFVYINVSTSKRAVTLQRSASLDQHVQHNQHADYTYTYSYGKDCVNLSQLQDQPMLCSHCGRQELIPDALSLS